MNYKARQAVVRLANIRERPSRYVAGMYVVLVVIIAPRCLEDLTLFDGLEKVMLTRRLEVHQERLSNLMFMTLFLK